jgi:hypothetical protein
VKANRIACLLAASALAVSPLGAADAVTARKPAAASAAKAALECATRVVGVQRDGTLMIRDMTNGVITDEKATPAALRFDPTGLAAFDTERVKGGYRMGIRATKASGRPAIITVAVRDRRPTAHVTGYQRMRNAHFHPGVFAGSASYFVFTGGRGRLTRWVTVRNAHGDIYYAYPTVVTNKGPRLRILSISYRKKVDGAVSDILWATSTSGRLLQIRIPVVAPDEAKVITVRKHGFDDVSGLSLSYCAHQPSTLSIVAINGADGTAQWLTIRHQFKPRGANLIDHGPAEAANWRLHGVF